MHTAMKVTRIIAGVNVEVIDMVTLQIMFLKTESRFNFKNMSEEFCQ